MTLLFCYIFIFSGIIELSLVTMKIEYRLNRKEGNDQKSIQLPITFRSKTPKGKIDALKLTAPQSKYYKQKTKGTFSSPKRLSKLKFHKNIHAKTLNDRHSKLQQKHHLGTISKILLGGLNRFYVSQDIWSVHEGSLTPQCNISENIKIKRIQR